MEIALKIILNQATADDEAAFEQNSGDWLKAYKTAKEYDSATLFYHNLKNKRFLRPEIVMEMESEIKLNKLWINLFALTLGEITRLNLPFILIKGLSLAAYYPESYLRKSVDIDILVPGSMIPAFGEQLNVLGYNKINEYGHQISWKKLLPVDLHNKLLLDYFMGQKLRSDYEFVQKYSRPVKITGQMVTVPDAEMTVFIILTHMAHHIHDNSSFIKRNFIDLYYLLKQSNIDWDKFTGLITDNYYRKYFASLLLEYEKTTGDKIPPAVFTALEVSAQACLHYYYMQVKNKLLTLRRRTLAWLREKKILRPQRKH